jgi:hypothetical protein
MAEITKLEIVNIAATGLNDLVVDVATIVHFNEFDRNTNINYSLIYRLVGIDAGEGEPVEVELKSYPPIVVEASEAVADGGNANDLILNRALDVRRGIADEDEQSQNPDELQVRVDLAPKLPQAATFLSNVSSVTLRTVAS